MRQGEGRPAGSRQGRGTKGRARGQGAATPATPRTRRGGGTQLPTHTPDPGPCAGLGERQVLPGSPQSPLCCHHSSRVPRDLALQCPLPPLSQLKSPPASKKPFSTLTSPPPVLVLPDRSLKLSTLASPYTLPTHSSIRSTKRHLLPRVPQPLCSSIHVSQHPTAQVSSPFSPRL